MAVVTISRQYGSGGDEIAQALCNALGYDLFDKRLMARVAPLSGLAESDVVDLSEDDYQVRSFLDRLLGKPEFQRVRLDLETWARGGAGLQVDEPDEQKTLMMVQTLIRAAYRRGKVVILGRGGQIVLRDLPHALHVRVIAPLETRHQRIRARDHVSQELAEEIAARRDLATSVFMKHFYSVDVSEPSLYDLTINTGKLGTDVAVEMILAAVRQVPSGEYPQHALV